MRAVQRGSGRLQALALVTVITLTSCASWIPLQDLPSGDLKGRVVVQWDHEDHFIYLKPSS
jgi:hypothetical protein